ncbi:hypothetical protein FHS60_001203 [Alloprevotella rava]|uniref:Uncharacterized protein n=1 Tax=Alloprevotella rava TaxID=671218 RepID=A0A7W5UEP0_9BACT|nr:hypothetical protein [Alloprevotella rava]
MLYINHRSFAVSDYQLLNLKEKSESLFKGNPHQYVRKTYHILP